MGRSYIFSGGVYLVIGGASALAEWASFFAMLQADGLHYLGAAVIAFGLATGINFVLSRSFGFVSRGLGWWRELLLVYAVSCGALVVNLTVMTILVGLAGSGIMAAKVVGTVAAFVLNFGLRQFFIFDSAPRWRWGGGVRAGS